MDGSTPDGRPRPDAARDASTEASPGAAEAGGGTDTSPLPRVRALSLVVQGAPWYATQFTQGIAADGAGRVFVGDDASIFVVEGSTVSTYLTAAETAGTGAVESGFGDFDIAPNGELYIVASNTMNGVGSSVGIVRSSAAHQAQPWVSLAGVDQPQELGVIGDGYVGLVSRDGLWTFRDGGGSLVYGAGALVAAETCATEDLATARSGVFLYQPGCNGYPLLRGRADGSGIAKLYETSPQQSPLAAQNFLCAARDVAGGFYIIVADASDGAPRLYHVAEDAGGTSGVTAVPTAPTFGEAKQSQSEVYGFEFCSLATAPDGTVFFQTYHQLWKVSP